MELIWFPPATWCYSILQVIHILLLISFSSILFLSCPCFSVCSSRLLSSPSSLLLLLPPSQQVSVPIIGLIECIYSVAQRLCEEINNLTGRTFSPVPTVVYLRNVNFHSSSSFSSSSSSSSAANGDTQSRIPIMVSFIFVSSFYLILFLLGRQK